MRTVTILTHSYLNAYSEGEGFVRPFGGGLERYMHDLCAVVHAKGWQPIVHQLSYYRSFDTVYEGTRVRGYPYELNDIAGAFDRMAADAEGLIVYASCIWHPIAYKPGSIGICHGINWDWPEFGDKVKSGVADMIQLAVDGLDRLVSVDSHFQTYCRAVCTFDDPEKLVLLPNAVDTAWFTGKDAEAGIGAGAEDGTQEKAVIGIVGGAEAAFGTEATEASRLRESAGAGGAEIAWASEAIGAADAENTDGHDAEDAESLDGRDAEDKESSDGHDAEDAEILERHDAQYAEDSPASEWTGNENAAALGAGGLAVADGLPETGELRLLFPRRLSYERGIVPMMLLADRLLAAFPSLIVEFAGELVEQTPVAVAFRLWLSTHGEQARIRHNTYTFQTVRDAYRAADVVVIPTVYSEGTSLSCLEAMSCGKAVVAANVGGLNDLITDGFNGRLVAPTVDALHAAVEELLRDAALRRQYGADASRTAAAFDLKRWKQRWAELLEAQFARNGL